MIEQSRGEKCPEGKFGRYFLKGVSMLLHRTSVSFALASIAIFALLTGCGQTSKDQAKKSASVKETKKGDDSHTDTKHAGYWCQEHGVPEEMCSLCSEKAEKACKDAGDWCKIHDRAQSQCFKCDPSKYEKFEAMYVAKFGKAPKRPPASEFEK